MLNYQIIANYRISGTVVAHIGEGTYAFILARYYHLITPRACARGKVIGFVCRRLSSSVVVVSTKIARSEDLSAFMINRFNQIV